MGRFGWWMLGASVALGGCAGDTTGTTGSCTTGSEGCPCYPNSTCNATLTCASHLCVSLGTGGNSATLSPFSGEPSGGFGPGAGGSLGHSGGTGNVPICHVGGYVVSDSWHGYAWTAAITSSAPGAAPTTISPTDFSAVCLAQGLCASGYVGPASDYGGAAMIGVNLNQAQVGTGGGNPAAQTVAISGTGITVTYSNMGGSVIRVQIQTPAGDTDPAERWCATLSGVGGSETILWEQFWGGVADTTQGCWNSGGAHPPAGTQIRFVGLLVPGGNANPVAFDFCLQGLAQAA